MTAPSDVRSIVLVLASWRRDAPAGMERATAGLAIGLAQAGHHPVIATAIPPSGIGLPGVAVEHLDVGVNFPCDDRTLRCAVTARRTALELRLADIAAHHGADTVLFIDALWGLGMLATPAYIRRVLAVHVQPDPQDGATALTRADVVIAPSRTVLNDAAVAGHPSHTWRTVPNALAHDPVPPPEDPERRRVCAPVRVLSRLGWEKGVHSLLAALPDVRRPVEIALAAADFEADPGSQAALLKHCRDLAEHCPMVTLLPGLPWDAVSSWLAGASAVVVPSARETFGLVAAEAMSVGTPFVSHRVGNLPDLLAGMDDAERLLVDPALGSPGLVKAVHDLLADPVTYAAVTWAVYYAATDYRPIRVAETFLKAVS